MTGSISVFPTHSIYMGGSIFEMFYFYFAHLSERTMPSVIDLTKRQSAVLHHSHLLTYTCSAEKQSSLVLHPSATDCDATSLT